MEIGGKKKWKRKIKKEALFTYTNRFPKKQDCKNIQKKQPQFTKRKEIFLFH